MTGTAPAGLGRFRRASEGFAARLRLVRPDQWDWPTPCAEWSVRQLTSHMARGNLSYTRLVEGGSGAEFLRLRDADAAGADPAAAYADSVRVAAAAFGRPGALDRTLDYPLGPISGHQALDIRTADTIVHTWDLARAIDADERLGADLVNWVSGNLAQIYAGLPDTPADPAASDRFFGRPIEVPETGAPGPGAPETGAPGTGAPETDTAAQDRLLRQMGRSPGVN